MQAAVIHTERARAAGAQRDYGAGLRGWCIPAGPQLARARLWREQLAAALAARTIGLSPWRDDAHHHANGECRAAGALRLTAGIRASSRAES